jgi:hypothetical protein
MVFPAENVDSETYGQTTGGHFRFQAADSEIFFEIERMDSPEKAEDVLRKRADGRSPEGGWTSSSRVKDVSGNFVGSKIMFFSHTAEEKRNYHLFWTKRDTLYSIHGETLKGIEDIERVCGIGA